VSSLVKETESLVLHFTKCNWKNVDCKTCPCYIY
jgi:hypothetical protein